MAARKISVEGAKDMESNAAIWAGHGTPLAVTPGDVETMAAPKAGFDPSLNPGGAAIESNHTVRTAAAEGRALAKGAK